MDKKQGNKSVGRVVRSPANGGIRMNPKDYPTPFFKADIITLTICWMIIPWIQMDNPAGAEEVTFLLSPEELFPIWQKGC
jgi:hypothetical protein